MRQIGQALSSYANANQGQLPPSLDALVQSGAISSVTLNCPTASKAGTMSTYIYNPLSPGRATPDAIVLYEPLSNHAGEGTNVLHIDGKVEWMTRNTANQLIPGIDATAPPTPAGSRR